jgi:hypothetical protein
VRISSVELIFKEPQAKEHQMEKRKLGPRQANKRGNEQWEGPVPVVTPPYRGASDVSDEDVGQDKIDRKGSLNPEAMNEKPLQDNG